MNWYDKLIIEKKELLAKIVKLEEDFRENKIPEEEIKILQKQLIAMKKYFNILRKRIKRHDRNRKVS